MGPHKFQSSAPAFHTRGVIGVTTIPWEFQAGVLPLEYSLKLRTSGTTGLPEAAARWRARNEGWRRIASLRSRSRR